MRIFIGTALSTIVSKDIESKLHEELSLPSWRVAPMEQWHVTTLFIGERPETVIPSVSETVASLAAHYAPILLEHGRIVTMPKQDPTMLWVRFRPNPGLTALHLALAKATGTEPSIYRPYWPHITLARSKAGSSGVVNGEVVVPSLRIDHLTLFHSTPSPQGSIHAAITSWRLTGTDPIAHAAVD